MTQIGIFEEQPGGHRAFIPSSFPPENLIKWSPPLVAKLSEADQAMGKLAAIEQLVPDVNFFLYMYSCKEAAHSSQIEGTQATLMDYIKAEAALENGKEASDVDEIKNYIRAMNYGMREIRKIPLSWRLIKGIHRKLLRGVRGENRSPGEFKRTQNWVGGRTIETASFVPPPHHKMSQALDDLENFFHESSSQIPPLVKAGLIHAQFETIHPFLDGNGRIGRLLITLYLHKEGILLRPLLYLSEYFKQHRSEYYEQLNTYRSEEGVHSWILFFLEGVHSVAEQAVSTAHKIARQRENDLEIISGFGRNTKTALKLLNALYRRPIINVRIAQEVTGIKSRTNMNNLIKKFVEKRILYKISKRNRNKFFLYKSYMAQFKDSPVK